MLAPDYFDGETFSGLCRFVAAAPDAVFDGCRFEQCRVAGADLSSFCLEDCTFVECDLSLAVVKGTAFKTVHFERCKLEGVNFFECCQTALSVSFTECNLRYASFSGLPLRKTNFQNCCLREAVFTRADLAGSHFDQCDLARAVFLHTHLGKADFSTAYHFVLDPDANFVRQAKFSVYGLPGLLEKYNLEIE